MLVDCTGVILLPLGQQHSLSFLRSPIASPNRLFLLLIPVNYRICELAVLWGKTRNSAFLSALFCIFPFCSPLWIWDRAPLLDDPPAFPVSCSFSSPVLMLLAVFLAAADSPLHRLESCRMKGRSCRLESKFPVGKPGTLGGYWANWDHKPPVSQKSTLEFHALNQDICIPNRAGQLFIPVLEGNCSQTGNSLPIWEGIEGPVGLGCCSSAYRICCGKQGMWW